jgi:hypothetical protein
LGKAVKRKKVRVCNTFSRYIEQVFIEIIRLFPGIIYFAGMQKIKWKQIAKRVLIGLLIILAVIQFIRPEKNRDTAITSLDMNVMYPIPDSVNEVLKKACFDCHSNNTRYPWYFNIQPVAWWMDDHIADGKKELNFSEFGKRTLPKQAKKLKKLAKEIQEGDMPMNYYTWIHKDAILSDAQKKMVIDWATGLSQKITAQLVADSLKKG